MFTVGGEMRVPREVHGRLDASESAAGIAAFLREQGAFDVMVRGGEVSFRVPLFTRRDSVLGPVDAGAVVLRDDGGGVVLTYRVRLRRIASFLSLVTAVSATVALNELGIESALQGVGVAAVWALWTMVLTRRRYPRVFVDAVAAAGQLPGPRPAHALLPPADADPPVG